MRYQFIRDRLKELEKTPADMARALDLPTSRIAELWSGKRNIQDYEVAPVADFLKWPVERFARELAKFGQERRLEARIARDKAELDALRQRTGKPATTPQRSPPSKQQGRGEG